MRATITVVRPATANREDVAVEAPAGTASGDVIIELRHLVGAMPTEPALLDGAPLDAAAPLGASGLRDGAIVTLGTPAGRTPFSGAGLDGTGLDGTEVSGGPPRGPLELRVVGGPSAGGVHPLATGTTKIGRGAGSGVVLDDPDVSRRHATITVSASSVTVADAGSTNGSTLDGAAIGTAPTPIAPGTRLRLGESTLVLAVPDEPPVAVTAMPDGGLCYNRPPRLDSPPTAATVEFPQPPQERPPRRLPVVATIAPLVAGVALALAMRRPEYLLFTVLSPVMAAGQWLGDHVGDHRTNRATRAAYDRDLGLARAALAGAVAAEESRRRRSAPNPASLLKIATAPSPRLWERRRNDPDFAEVRLGLGTLPAVVQAINADAEKPCAHDVPVTVSLTRVGVLGVAGPARRTAALTRSLVGQLAALHSPRDLGIVVLTQPARAGAWEWVRWLPHLRPGSATSCQALVGLDPETVAARIGELNTLIATRLDPAADSERDRHRATVVIVDGARESRNVPGFTEVLTRGPEAGVFGICLDTDESRLPEECGAVAIFDGDVGTRVTVRTHSAPADVEAVADGVSTAWAERIGRALAPVRDDTTRTGSQALPDAVRWRDLAGLSDNQLAQGVRGELLERWQRSAGGSTEALIGAGAGGLFTVDIAKDGPHTLVAGTTGSGKSELLRTLVGSLAVANRPDELTFVLVDYKGGAAFGSCAALPHTVGLVTDLDGNLVERALVSLGAELRRREALLAAVGVANIDAYRGAGYKLARLVIVVDEFASLAEELPDFVGGLVGIAQRGRSLGVHLVLATQRPEGVVSADIRANTNLRICLAVMRDTESRDVIDAPDAARISRTTPGRGYVRTGHSELHLFQSGRIGGAAVDETPCGVDVRRSPFRALAAPPPKPSRVTPDDGTKTDLDVIVDACREAAIRLDIETPPSPWLAPLPAVVVSPDTTPALTAVLGVRDLPAKQAREPYIVDLVTTGHLLVAGSARAGRTTALRTLAGALARSTSTADLHFFTFDCAGGSLATFGALPHCGAVVSTHDADRARRLTAMLSTELVSRQTALAAGGFGSISEQRSSGSTTPLPHVVVFIDGWEAFVSAFDELDAGAVVDGVFRLLREGPAVGIHVVVSAERAGLVGRLASAIDNRLVLRLADRNDLAMIGLPTRAIPTDLPAGRGFLAGDLTQTQVCLLDPDPSGAAQLAALAAVAASATARDAAVPRNGRPRRVEQLPTHVPYARLPAPARSGPRCGRVTIGVGGDELDAVTVDLLEQGPGFVVAGPSRSGRSTTLSTIATGLRDNGWHVVAVTARPSAVTRFADRCFDTTSPDFETAIREATDPVAILVDDAELVVDTPVGSSLDRLTRTARDSGHVVAIAGTTEDLSVGFRGFVVDARRCRTGILLTPRTPLDGEVLGVRLPRDTGGRLPAGRGLLVARGESAAVQVAIPGPAS